MRGWVITESWPGASQSPVGLATDSVVLSWPLIANWGGYI